MNTRVATLIVCALLALLTPGAVFGQDAPKPPAPGGCALQFETTHHDLGEISDTAPARFTFKFKNVSDRRVTLSRTTLVGGCSACTPPAFNKKFYEPGEAGEVLVTFNPQNRKGPQTKTVIVESDDPNCPRFDVTLSMKVMPLVYIEPSKIFFSEAMRGAGATQTVTVTGCEPNFEIAAIEGLSPAFTVTKTKTEPFVEEGRTLTRVTLEVTLAKDAPLGTHNFTFTLCTNDPKADRVKMPVAGTVVGEIRASPPGMLVRTFMPSTPFQAQVRLDARNGRAFNVKGIDVDGPDEMNLGVDFQPVIENGKPIVVVTLSGSTPAAVGQYRGVITVETDMPGEEPFKFNWIASVRERPAGTR